MLPDFYSTGTQQNERIHKSLRVYKYKSTVEEKYGYTDTIAFRQTNEKKLSLECWRDTMDNLIVFSVPGTVR